MDIKIVDDAKIVECDVLIVNKFKDELTSNTLINKFAPVTFKGEVGETFVIHTRNEAPATYVMGVGFGEEKDIDADILRKAITKAVKKCIEMKADTIAFDINTNITFGVATLMSTAIANYSFDKYKSKKNHRISQVYISHVSNDVSIGNVFAASFNMFVCIG